MSHVTSFADVPKPSRRELRRRGNVVVQLWRFAALNAKMLVMVTLGHH